MNIKMNNPKNKKLSSILYIVLALTVVLITVVALYSAIMSVARRSPEPSGTEAESTEAHGGAPEPVTAEPEVTSAEKPSLDAAVTDEAGDALAVNGEGEEEPLPTFFRLPVNGSVAKTHDEDTLVYSLTMNDYRVHTGIDVSAPVGTAVVACADGVVDSVRTDDFCGTCVTVRHGGGLTSTYCGLSPTLPAGIAEGATLLAGTVIGSVGDSMVIEAAEASHLHLDMTLDGKTVNPLDYLSYDAAVTDYED